MEPLELDSNLYTHFSRALLFVPASVQGFLVLLKILFEDFLLWCTRPCEVFFRYKFGTRGHSLFQTVQICLMALLLSSFASYDPLLAAFALASAGLSIYHLVEARRWEKNGSPPRFSRSHGEPMPWWNFVARGLKALGVDLRRVPMTAMICRFGEPIMLLALAMAVNPFSKALSIYFFCCTGATFIKGLIVRNRIVNLQRDQADARVLSQYLIDMQRASAGQQQERTFVVRLAAPVLGQPAAKKERLPKPAKPAAEKPPAAASAAKAEYIRLECDNCGRRFKVHGRHRGRKGKCKSCGVPVAVG